MKAFEEWPLPGSIIATLLMLRGAWALWRDFRKWERGLSADMDRRARGEFVTGETRRSLE